MKIETNGRGFPFATFKDLLNQRCMIQKSSSTNDRIWFGIEDRSMPETPRMHLSQEMVANLLPVLQRFVETGEIQESKPMKEHILLTIDDLVTAFTYYDRKEDEELSVKQLNEAVKNGEISIDEMTERFKNGLKHIFEKQ